jgi:hypothetical protein
VRVEMWKNVIARDVSDFSTVEKFCTVEKMFSTEMRCSDHVENILPLFHSSID